MPERHLDHCFDAAQTSFLRLNYYPPCANALVINIGNIVQVWSNDNYRAPLPSVCDAAHLPRYRLISWGEFRAARAAGDYADYGEEVQISHYRIGAEATDKSLVSTGGAALRDD